MAPKRPPPLPRSLFVGNGPLAPGSAPLPPSPSTIHPPAVLDAHYFPAQVNYPPLRHVAGPSGDIPVIGVVQVQMDATRPRFIDNADELKTISTYPTIINPSFPHPPSIASQANGAIDIILPFPKMLTESEWDLIDEAVNALDESWARQPGSKAADENEAMEVDHVVKGRKIVISGLVPPPLTKPSSPLLQSDEYNLHLARLAQLSLHANVYLKALPPVTWPGDTYPEPWWEDAMALDRVVRMYVAPAIETFGTHRIIFGAAPAVPHNPVAPPVVPVKGAEWYALFRNIVAQLGEGDEAMSGIMKDNAIRVYSLK